MEYFQKSRLTTNRSVDAESIAIMMRIMVELCREPPVEELFR